MWRGGLVVVGLLVASSQGNYPVFDTNTQMRLLLLPSDARTGSIIYRLRATDSDKDYPLTFDATDYGSYVIRIDNLPCSKNSSHCEANVFLERSVVPDQLFKFRITVKDTKGDTTTIPVAIQVTDGVTEFNEVFPHIPGVIMIPESTEVGTELEYVIVRKNPRNAKSATLELWGSSNFKFQQSSTSETTTGVITLAAPLDYETKTMYKLSIFSVGMYVDLAVDTRNVAGFQVVVIVSDVQDTPPVWDHIEPVTKLRSNLTQGDFILKVTARDGDKGSPRDVKYGLVSEGNPFTVFFSIDQTTGEIRLDRSLKELVSISRPHQPILLTVVAEEVVLNKDEPPALSSTATVALLLSEVGNSAPYFESHNYVTRIDENSLQGTALVFGDPYIAEVRDDDMGKQGIFSLELLNNNGTFEISPAVTERQAQFIIRVRDNSLLDYEANKELNFKIVARELNPGRKQLSSTVDVVVYISDVNDNAPKFKHDNYSAQIPENTTVGMQVLTVRAEDMDTGEAGLVKYTSILGYKNTSLNLHPDTGVITIANTNPGLDREETNAYQFYVEARDMSGVGNRALVPFTLYVMDVNDNAPYFEKTPIEFILGADGMNFSQKAIIKAIDADAEEPNNIVYYEIISGNYGNKFILNSTTGELTVNTRNTRVSRQAALQTVTNLIVRAYDLGVPTKWTSAEVRIFPAESGARVMRFIVPGNNPDRYSTEQMLAAITGGRVVIHSIVPVTGQPHFQARTTDLAHAEPNNPDNSNGGDKSMVTATILYNNNAVVDLETLQKRLIANHTTIIKSEPVTVYKGENTTLFWVLIVLLLLLFIAVLTLLICCLCAACPLYGMYNRKRSIVHSTEHINYMVHGGRENKEVQAEWVNSAHKEAWNGDASHRQWSYNNNRQQNGRRVHLLGHPSTPEPYHHELKRQPSTPQPYRQAIRHPSTPQPYRVQAHQQQPNIIFTRQMGHVERRQQDELILEDIDGTEFRLLDPSRLSLRTQRPDPDADSIRRHDYDRGSVMFRSREEIIHGKDDDDDDDDDDEDDDRPPSRDQMFIRDGNAEILRLVTRGKLHDEEDTPKLNEPDRPLTDHSEHMKEEKTGKQVILTRFIEDQRNSAKSREERILQGKEASDVQSENPSEHRGEFLRKLLEPEHNISTAEVNRLTAIQRDLLLTRFLVEEQRRSINRASIVEDTQSLPGMMAMATQTDVDAETQTDKVYFAKRKSKSDNDDSMSDSDDQEHKRFKKIRRFRKPDESKLADFVIKNSLHRHKIKTPIMEESESALEIANGTMLAPERAISAARKTLSRSVTLRPEDEIEEVTRKVYIPVPGTSRQHVIKMKSMSTHDIPSAPRQREDVIMSLQVTPIKQLNIPKGPNILIENVQYGEPGPKSSMSVTNVSSISLDPEPVVEPKPEPEPEPKTTLKPTPEPTTAHVPEHRMSRLEVRSAEKRKPRRASASEPPRRNRSQEKNGSSENLKRSHSRDSVKKTVRTVREDRSTPRYMEWYKKKREEREMKKRLEQEEEEKRRQKKWERPKPVRKRLPAVKTAPMETTSSSKLPQPKQRPAAATAPARKTAAKKKDESAEKDKVKTPVKDTKVESTAEAVVTKRRGKETKDRSGEEDPSHESKSPETQMVQETAETATRAEGTEALANGSEEITTRRTPPPEPDSDAENKPSAPPSQRIAMKNQELMEKKSIFTIAYDEMQIKPMRINTGSPP